MYTKNPIYVKSIETKSNMIDRKHACIKYQPIGKMLWVKLPENGNIIRLRCEYVWVEKNGDLDEVRHLYVGANGKTYVGNTFGLYSTRHLFNTTIYDNYEDCINGTNKYKYNGTYYGTIGEDLDLLSLIRKTYGSLECVKFEGPWRDNLTICPFYLKNGKINQERVNFAIWVDKDGAHFNVVELDNGNMFASREKALATYKPKVYDFDDAEDEISVYVLPLW